MTNNNINHKIIELYKKDKQIYAKCNVLISEYPLVRLYKSDNEMNTYIALLNSIIKLVNPDITEIIVNCDDTTRILFDLFSKTNYVSSILQCPWGNTISSIIVSIYSPEYYFYSLSHKDVNTILKKLKLYSIIGLKYPEKQTLLKQIYILLSANYPVSPYMFCNLLL